MNPTTTAAPTTTRCRDRFAGWPESVLPGRECDAVVPAPGWACDTHRAAFYAVMATPITDVEDEREAKARREAQAMDPAVVALIAEARAYLTACAGRPEGARVPEFIATLVHDPKYGTKWFRITENMAGAIIRTRDAEAAQAATVVARPRDAEAVKWVQDNAPHNDFAGSLLVGLRKWGRLTDGQYNAVLRSVDRDAPAARPDGTVPERITQDGWYQVGDDVFKVQVAVHGSGRLYAKRLVVIEHGQASWEYAPGMVARLTEADRLTVEAAAAFGTLYGICAVCGRTLTDEGSIEAGIGPVCIKRLG
jgi:hypothetical protein